MTGTFALIDLPLQALAIERLLSGRPEGEKLAWLGVHGRVDLIAHASPPQTYLFQSALGLRCVFFLAGDKIVFLGDNTTYTVNAEGERPNLSLQRTRPAAGLIGTLKRLLGGPVR